MKPETNSSLDESIKDPLWEIGVGK